MEKLGHQRLTCLLVAWSTLLVQIFFIHAANCSQHNGTLTYPAGTYANIGLHFPVCVALNGLFFLFMQILDMFYLKGLDCRRFYLKEG
ncbi:hypothetical protein ACSBR2_040249 [Camellia fascicularis]